MKQKPKKRDRLDIFIDKFEAELHRRYNECPDTAAPSTILLAVLNAVEEAKQYV